MKDWWRDFRAGWRDTLILLREFRLPILVFVITVIGGGLAYEAIANHVGEPVESTAEAIFIIWSATLLYSVEGFPDHFVLQLFHFFMPLVGLIIFARGLADSRDSSARPLHMLIFDKSEYRCPLLNHAHDGAR